MTTALPLATDFTGASITEAQFKTAITNLHDYLAGMFGTTGVPKDALLALNALLTATSAKTGAYTVVAGDKGTLIDCTANTWTLSLTAAATLGSGFAFAVRNSGSGVITIDPNASELIDGAATISLAAGESCFVTCDGTGFKTIGKTITPPTPFAYKMDVQLTAGAWSFTKPAGATKALVHLQAGGGGSGGGSGGATTCTGYHSATGGGPSWANGTGVGGDINLSGSAADKYIGSSTSANVVKGCDSPGPLGVGSGGVSGVSGGIYGGGSITTISSAGGAGGYSLKVIDVTSLGSLGGTVGAGAGGYGNGYVIVEWF